MHLSFTRGYAEVLLQASRKDPVEERLVTQVSGERKSLWRYQSRIWRIEFGQTWDAFSFTTGKSNEKMTTDVRGLEPRWWEDEGISVQGLNFLCGPCSVLSIRLEVGLKKLEGRELYVQSESW